MTNCTVSTNSTKRNGGGVNVVSSAATLTNVTITNNTSYNASARGISISSTGGKKQKGARANRKNQPELEPGQKMADQGGRRLISKDGKPDGGADKGPRSIR